MSNVANNLQFLDQTKQELDSLERRPGKLLMSLVSLRYVFNVFVSMIVVCYWLVDDCSLSHLTHTDIPLTYTNHMAVKEVCEALFKKPLNFLKEEFLY